MPWSPYEIAEVAAKTLRQAAEAMDAEQAVRGLDALEELALHPILVAGFAAAGFGVVREQPYPGAPGHPIRRERERCDLVLTEQAGMPLLDPVAARREALAAEGTLFGACLPAEAAPPGVRGDEAFWLEIKIAGQFCFTDGVPGPNPSYVSDMTACVADLAKLTRDPVILHAATLTVVFSQDERTLRHDLAVVIDRALGREIPLAAPIVEVFPIADRIGNAVAGVGLVPLRKATLVEF